MVSKRRKMIRTMGRNASRKHSSCSEMLQIPEHPTGGEHRPQEEDCQEESEMGLVPVTKFYMEVVELKRDHVTGSSWWEMLHITS